MGVGLCSKCPCLRAEGQCFWAVFSDMSPESCRGIDGVSMSSVFSSTSMP